MSPELAYFPSKRRRIDRCLFFSSPASLQLPIPLLAGCPNECISKSTPMSRILLPINLPRPTSSIPGHRSGERLSRPSSTRVSFPKWFVLNPFFGASTLPNITKYSRPLLQILQEAKDVFKVSDRELLTLRLRRGPVRLSSLLSLLFLFEAPLLTSFSSTISFRC